jgi:hypothetical protein
MFPQWPRLTHATYLSLSLTHTQLDISNCDTFKIEYILFLSCSYLFFILYYQLPLHLVCLSLSLLSFSFSLPHSLCLCIIFTLSLCLCLARSLSPGTRRRESRSLRARVQPGVCTQSASGASTWRSRPRARGWGRA